MFLKFYFARLFESLKGIRFRKIPESFRVLKFKVTLIPETTNLKARQFSGGKLLMLVIAYTLAVMLFTVIAIYYTPLTRFIGAPPVSMTEEQNAQFSKLDRQLRYLAAEFEKLQSSNRLLRDALAKSDTAAITNTIKKTAPKGLISRRTGNVFSMLENWLSVLLQEKQAHQEFLSPASGFISNGFRPESGHFGIDFSLDQGSPVFAVAGGYVIFADYTTDDGNMLILAHADGFISVYKHCAKVLKRPRQRVAPGETVAISGNSGRLTSAAHLHFELWKNGTPLDPAKFLIIR